MSIDWGGLLYKEPGEVMQYVEGLRHLERWLREKRKHDAADEILKYILAIETAERRLRVMHEYVFDIIKAADRVVGMDGGEHEIDRAVENLGVKEADD